MEELNYLLNLSEDIACRLDNLSLDGESVDEYETIRVMAWEMVHKVKTLACKTDE